MPRPAPFESHKRVSSRFASHCRPRLDALPQSLRSLERSRSRRRFTSTSKSAQFNRLVPEDPKQSRERRRLLSALRSALYKATDRQTADSACTRFQTLAEEFSATGVLIFGDLVSEMEFGRFVGTYDALMLERASRQLLHDFLDLEGLALLDEPGWSNLVLHPIFRLLIHYRLGSPVRVIDVRAKDTFPIDVWAKENILHLDNSPFAAECKVILTWRKGQPLGPDGQDLVLLPGPARRHGIHSAGSRENWSSENETLFARPSEIGALLASRAREATACPLAVKVSDPARPLTTLFASSDIPHHRYRSARSHPRSSITIAYQRVVEASALEWVLAYGDADKLLGLLTGGPSGGGQIPLRAFEMPSADLERWRQETAAAPTIETCKRRSLSGKIPSCLPERQFLRYIAQGMMSHDLAALLDLKLYADGREEHRKAARKLLRELPAGERLERLACYRGAIRTPHASHILSNRTLAAIGTSSGRRCSAAITRMADHPGKQLAASLAQLLIDLGEASERTYSLQCFVSTNLMLFLAVDLARRLGVLVGVAHRANAVALARSYVAGTLAHGLRLRARMPDRFVP